MSEGCKNYYKTCRENVGMTQEYTAGALNVSVRTLSDYENDKAPVPDDIVDRMCELYDTRYLAMWHLKNKSSLGRYLPEIFVPETIGDMMFAFSLAEDGVAETYEAVRDIFRDRQLSADEIPAMQHAIVRAKDALNNLTSTIFYAEQMVEQVIRKRDTQV